MDVRVVFEDLEQMIQRFQNGAQQYMDCIQALQAVGSNFENGGFLGRCGQNFLTLMQNDLAAIQQFEQLFEQASQLLGDTITEMQQADQNLQSQMPS
jgi:WXG100 family type VII secretion target